MKRKYITFNIENKMTAVIFGETLNHDHVARMVDHQVVSAGFLFFTEENTVNCFGKSVTLKKSSSSNDSELLSDLMKSTSIFSAHFYETLSSIETILVLNDDINYSMNKLHLVNESFIGKGTSCHINKDAELKIKGFSFKPSTRNSVVKQISASYSN